MQGSYLVHEHNHLEVIGPLALFSVGVTMH